MKFLKIPSVKNLKIYDIVMAMLVISSLAFYDVKIIFLGTQALAFLVTFIKVIERRKISNSVFKFIIWVTFFVGYSFLTCLWAKDYNTTAVTVSMSTAQVGLIALCMLIYSDTESKNNYLINLFVIASVILSIRFFVEIPPNSWGKMERFSDDTIFGGNTTAMTLSFAAVMLFYKSYMVRAKKGHSPLTFIFICLFIFITILMGTKKGLLIVALGIGMIYIFNSKNPIKLIFRLITIVIVTIIAYVAIMNIPLFYSSIGYRIEGLFANFIGGKADSSTISRSAFIRDAFRVFKENPILGVGQDGYRYVNQYERTYSHCNYTEILSNLGIIGFGIYYSVYIYSLTKAIKNLKTCILPLTLTVCILIIQTALVSYNDEMSYIILAICMVMLNQENNRNVQKSY